MKRSIGWILGLIMAGTLAFGGCAQDGSTPAPAVVDNGGNNNGGSNDTVADEAGEVNVQNDTWSISFKEFQNGMSLDGLISGTLEVLAEKAKEIYVTTGRMWDRMTGEDLVIARAPIINGEAILTGIPKSDGLSFWLSHEDGPYALAMRQFAFTGEPIWFDEIEGNRVLFGRTRDETGSWIHDPYITVESGTNNDAVHVLDSGSDRFPGLGGKYVMASEIASVVAKLTNGGELHGALTTNPKTGDARIVIPDSSKYAAEVDHIEVTTKAGEIVTIDKYVYWVKSSEAYEVERDWDDENPNESYRYRLNAVMGKLGLSNITPTQFQLDWKTADTPEGAQALIEVYGGFGVDPITTNESPITVSGLAAGFDYAVYLTVYYNGLPIHDDYTEFTTPQAPAP